MVLEVIGWLLMAGIGILDRKRLKGLGWSFRRLLRWGLVLAGEGRRWWLFICLGLLIHF
jgi:hypothetical protein